MAQSSSVLEKPSGSRAHAPTPPSAIPPDVAALQEEIRLLAELKSRVEGSLVQLQAANARLAAEELIHRQRLLTAQAFIQAFLHSSIWKATAPIRLLRALLRPRGCTANHLVPEQHLEAAPGERPLAWTCTTDGMRVEDGVRRPRVVTFYPRARRWSARRPRSRNCVRAALTLRRGDATVPG